MSPTLAFSRALHVANSCRCVCSQSERRPGVRVTERVSRPPPPPPGFSPSSVLGRPSVTMSLSVTNMEPTSPRSATPASDSAGVWMPTARRSPTPGPDPAALLYVSHDYYTSTSMLFVVSGMQEYSLPHLNNDLSSPTQVLTMQ